MLNRAVYKQTLIMLALAVGGTCILSCSPPQRESREYDARIAIESDASGIKARAYCRNSSSQDAVISYELKAKRTGRAGTAQSSQSGSVEIGARDELGLSQLSLSVSPEDSYEIDLKVYRDGEFVAGDSVSYPEEL